MEKNYELKFKLSDEVIKELGIDEHAIFDAYYEDGTLHVCKILTSSDYDDYEDEDDDYDYEDEEDENYIDCTKRNCEDCEYFCPHCGNCIIVDEKEE